MGPEAEREDCMNRDIYNRRKARSISTGNKNSSDLLDQQNQEKV